jgi:gamma-glutamylcyclotransferase (GGCT)/AIG2-like uncharacterized protein YtfP
VTYHKSSEYKILNVDRPYIAHFRYATVGAVGRDNTHPFKCGRNQNEWLMMNGTIANLGDHKTSDSKALAIKLGDINRPNWADELAKHSSRFVTINTQNKTFQIYNKHLWTQRAGVWYSKANVLEDNLVAVYGTLKRGYSNYNRYLTTSKFVGSGKTKDKYPLIIKGLPYMIEERGKGHHVEVDIFKVSDAKLQDLDGLEGHPHWYRRKQVPIQMGNRTLNCWLYFNIKEKAVGEFHKTYTQKSKPPKYWDMMDAEESIKVVEPAKKQPMFSMYDLYDLYNDVDEFDDCNDFICTECSHELEFDGFSNYHCQGCDGWFSRRDVTRFLP